VEFLSAMKIMAVFFSLAAYFEPACTFVT